MCVHARLSICLYACTLGGERFFSFYRFLIRSCPPNHFYGVYGRVFYSRVCARLPAAPPNVQSFCFVDVINVSPGERGWEGEKERAVHKSLSFFRRAGYSMPICVYGTNFILAKRGKKTHARRAGVVSELFCRRSIYRFPHGYEGGVEMCSCVYVREEEDVTFRRGCWKPVCLMSLARGGICPGKGLCVRKLWELSVFGWSSQNMPRSLVIVFVKFLGETVTLYIRINQFYNFFMIFLINSTENVIKNKI